MTPEDTYKKITPIELKPIETAYFPYITASLAEQFPPSYLLNEDIFIELNLKQSFKK